MRIHIAVVATAMTLTACASTGANSPGGTSAAKPAAVKLYAMDCGSFHLKDAAAFSDDGAYKGQVRDLVDPCYLIRHPKGDLIWDTGVPASTAVAPSDPFAMRQPVKLVDELAQLKLSPAAVTYVSFSHTHFDHAGNGSMFSASTFIVDEKEREWMFRDEARKSKDFPDWAGLETAKTITMKGEADYDVFGDGSVLMVATHGHTPGHRVLLVHLKSAGNVILAGDMWHLAESRAARRVPIFNTNKADTLASMDKVEALAKAKNARIVRQHVPEDFAAMPKFPKALE
jgi:glyoxylase-like metal-dependent hydrolase (beta-lactamase superfamily II)